MEEIWRKIKGYEDYYEVSDTGRVRGLDRYVRIGHCASRLVKGKELTQTVLANEYLVVSLSKNQKVKRYLVHRLVAETFLDNPNGFPEVNHKDENRKNNHVENLEWCNKSYNQLYSLKLHPERAYVFGDNFKDPVTKESLSPYTKKHIPHKYFKKVAQKTLDGETVAEYENANEIHYKLNFDAGFIAKCCDGQYSTAYGYKWEWAES